jgi:hypothetical protein
MAAADADWLPVSDEQYTELLDRERTAMAWSLALERRLLEIAAAFDAAGVDFVVLKGPALAHAVYPSPSWRTFNDLDVLVRTSQWESACHILAGEFGWPRRLPEPRRGFDVRFGKAAVFTTETGQQIDLHLNLAQGPFGSWIDPTDLFSSRVNFEIGPAVVRRSSDVHLFIHACVHAVLGDVVPTLLQCRDIIQTSYGVIDTIEAERAAASWHVGAVVTRALALASPIDEGVLMRSSSRFAVHAREGRALDAYQRTVDHRRILIFETIRAIPRIRNKIRYTLSLAFPTSSFLRVRTPSRSAVQSWASRVSYARAAVAKSLKRPPN